eukprot:5711127-Amphidinium_carterae.1
MLCAYKIEPIWGVPCIFINAPSATTSSSTTKDKNHATTDWLTPGKLFFLKIAVRCLAHVRISEGNAQRHEQRSRIKQLGKTSGEDDQARFKPTVRIQ